MYSSAYVVMLAKLKPCVQHAYVNEIYIQVFFLEGHLKGRGHLGDLAIDGRKKLKLFLWKYSLMMWGGFSRPGLGFLNTDKCLGLMRRNLPCRRPIRLSRVQNNVLTMSPETF